MTEDQKRKLEQKLFNITECAYYVDSEVQIIQKSRILSHKVPFNR